MKHQIIVGNIGTVYDGDSAKEAKKAFKEYKEQSREGYGRAAYEQVNWTRDGHDFAEFRPKLRTPSITELAKALKVGTIPCAIVRDGRTGWCLKLPKKITRNGGIEELSDVKLLNFGNFSKMRCRMEAISRYLALAYPDSEVVYINLRNAMKMPNWGGRFGALPELARAMKKASLIP